MGLSVGCVCGVPIFGVSLICFSVSAFGVPPKAPIAPSVASTITSASAVAAAHAAATA